MPTGRPPGDDAARAALPRPDFSKIPPEGREYHRCLRAVATAIQAVDRLGESVDGGLKGSFEELAAGFGAQKALLLAVSNAEDPARLALRGVYSAGLTQEQIEALEGGESLRGVSHTIIREAIGSGTVRVMEHPSFHRKAGITKAFTAQDDFSVLCAPIFDPERRRVIAVMYFQNSGPDYKNAYRDYDVRFLEPYQEALQRVLYLHFQKQQREEELENVMAGRERPDDAPEIIGSSSATVALRRLIHKTWIPAMEAPDPSPILIRGETGTGKDLVARYLHAWSSRRNKPFVAINGGQVSTNPDMARSTFHGHTKNAFTGAMRDEPGAFRAANKGVLFIDEVGELSEQGQLSLLRLLDNSKVAPLGDSREYAVDVMVILATNRDLGLAVQEGRVKRDFLARFETQTILIAPLRDRPADLRSLIDHFIRARERLTKKKTLGLTDEALQALLQYSWPANVREVRDVCKLLLTHAEPASRIDLQLIEAVYPRAIFSERNPRGAQLAGGAALTLKQARDILVRDMIRGRIEHFDGNMTRAAQSLGIERTYLYRLMVRLGLTTSSNGKKARDDDDPA